MTFRMAPLAAAGLLALSALNAWLVAVVVRDDVSEAPVPAAQSAWAPKPSGSSGSMPNAKPITAYSETLAHPIFSKSREPFVPPPPPPAPVPKVVAPPPLPVDPGIVMGGVVINGVLRKAYLFNKADAQGMWVSEGENFNGWTVQAIDPVSTKLQQAERTIELQLYGRR